MTNVYFVRHTQSDNSIHDDMCRPLTAKGMHDRRLVSDYLKAKDVSVICSSPYKRAYDTISEFAEQSNITIHSIADFRESEIADVWIEDYNTYAKQQWSDFNYKLSSGESLGEVQSRNIKALLEVLADHPEETIVIGSHGTALSTIINYFDKSFTYERFVEIVGLMPWIVHLQFEGQNCVSINLINLFDQQ